MQTSPVRTSRRALEAHPRAPKRRQPDSQASWRSCVVCRRRAQPLALVRLRLLDAHLSAPAADAPTGRGAYICIARACLEGVAQRHVARGFRGLGQVPAEGVRTQVHTCAAAQLDALLGLARRCGALVYGVSQVAALQAQAGISLSDPVDARAPTVLLATDMAERSRHKLGGGVAYATAAHLAHMTGLTHVAAVAILPGRLSLQAAYWLRVWYETGDTPMPFAPGSRPSTANQTSHNAIEVAR